MKTTYHIDVEPEYSGGFFIRVREFPGCMSDGETIGEALLNVSDAMIAWISCAIRHGDKIPDGKKNA